MSDNTTPSPHDPSSSSSDDEQSVFHYDSHGDLLSGRNPFSEPERNFLTSEECGPPLFLPTKSAAADPTQADLASGTSVSELFVTMASLLTISISFPTLGLAVNSKWNSTP